MANPKIELSVLRIDVKPLQLAPHYGFGPLLTAITNGWRVVDTVTVGKQVYIILGRNLDA